MKKKTKVTWLVLAVLFAGVALIPGYANAGLGMAIGAACVPVAGRFIGALIGEDNG